MSTTVPVLTVTELNSEIHFQLSSNFTHVFVCGEISGLSQPKSGHQYFSLKDAQSQIRGVIWKGNSTRAFQSRPFELSNGISVICGGSISVYSGRGEYQLNVRTIVPFGEGPMELALRQLRERLDKEGLFDPAHKRPLPKYPKRIAVITSPTGAAIRDFLHVLRPRWSDLKVTILPVSVQGEGAAKQIASALQAISNFTVKPDIVVVTRGGGSSEDLWCFNEEIVCRAIYHCPVPVVCGVGHEIDVTLADFVADVRALTPSDAALRIVPDRVEILRQLEELRKLLVGRLTTKYEHAVRSLESFIDRPVLAQPLVRYQNLAMELDRISAGLDRAMQSQCREQDQSLKQLAGRLVAINPAAVLARGYSLTCDEGGNLVLDSTSVERGSMIKTQLAHGSLTSRIVDVF